MAQEAIKRTTSTIPTVENTTNFERFMWNFSDTLVMTKRNLVYYTRQPQLIVFATVQPVMFLLLFTYVFGGAIDTGAGTGDYINFLLPGVLVQTVVFAATQTTVGLSDDLSKGMIDRFRSLPMARSAVLAGRTLADTVRMLFTIVIMLAVGTLIGFRFQDGLFNGLIGVAVAVAFGHAFTWISALIGLLVKNPEAAQVAGFIWVFPLVFASSIFVPPETMPDWLAAFAENQPITAIANAIRAMFLGGPFGGMDEVLIALAWSAAIFVIFVPLAVWQYRRVV